MKNSYSAALALACLIPNLPTAALAQEQVTLTTAGQPARSRVLTTTTANDPEWFSKTIDVDIKNATLEEAIKKVLEAAKVKIERVEDQLKANKNKLSLKLDDVNVRDALAAVARLYGAQAYVLTENEKTIVELRKRTADALTISGNVLSPFSGQGGATAFGSATGFGPGGVFIAGNTERYKDLPEKSLNIEIKEGNALDVIKEICKQAGLEYKIEENLKSDSKVSLTMRGVSVGNALDNAAGWLGCGWKAEKKGEKVTILFGKKYPGPGFRWTKGANGRSQVFTAPSPTMPVLPDLPIIGNLFRPATLPSKRVSLDKKSTDVRECLKEILKNADISYALADDLPSEPKSFTFSNVPISTALDMICESIEVGWTVEAGSDGKPLVRVGKRYRARVRNTSSLLAPGYQTLPSRLTDRFRRPSRVPIDLMLL